MYSQEETVTDVVTLKKATDVSSLAA